jgi:GntR family transcriptional regulator
MSMERYRVSPGGPSPNEIDQGAAPHRLDRQFGVVDADGLVAELFEVPHGTTLLRRDFVFFNDEGPVQMSTSYLKHALVDGTPVADPGNKPWRGGTIAQLAGLGVTVTAVEEDLHARMPTCHEAETLQIPPRVPVFAVTRLMLAGDQFVELAHEIVIPGDRMTLAYRIDLG